MLLSGTAAPVRTAAITNGVLQPLLLSIPLTRLLLMSLLPMTRLLLKLLLLLVVLPLILLILLRLLLSFLNPTDTTTAL